MLISSITPFFAAILLFVGFFLLPSSTLATTQQTTETTGTTTISTTGQNATTSGSTNPITFTLIMKDEGAGEAGVSSSPTTSAATSSSLSTRNIAIDVNIVRGNEAPAIILPINVTIPANVNNLELCASSSIVTFGAAAEMCEPVLHTIDLTQSEAATATDDTTSSGTTTSPFSSPSSSSSPTITAPPTTSSPPATMTAGGANSLIGGGGIEDNAAIMIPITVIAPITADIQNAQLCAQLLSSGVQSCSQVMLNPQETSYSPVNVDMTTSPTPTVISSEGTVTTGTGGGAATSSSSSSSTTTTITATPGTTSTTPPTTTTTTTPPTSTNSNNTTTTGGTTSSLPASGGRDTTAPTLTVPNDMALQTNGPTALLEYSVRAQDDRDGTATLDEDNQLIQGDNVGGRIIISCSPSSQYFLPVGNRTVECSAFDAVNNTGTASFVVSVTRPTTLPGGTSRGSAGGITASLTVNPAAYNGPCPNPDTQFTGTITDNVGNRDVRYRYVRSDGATDTQEKVIHFDQPGSQSVSTSWSVGPSDNPPGGYEFHGWMAIEILQPIQLQSNRAEFQITCPPSTGGGSAPGGTDTIAPSLSVPVDRVIPAITGTYIPYDVSATDNVDGTARLDANNKLTQEDNVGGSVTIACDPPPSSLRPLGNYTIGCTATDAAGNRGTASFVVSVIKATANTPPVGSSSGSGDITVRAIGVTPSHYEGPPCPPPPYTFSGEITDSIGGRDITYRFAGTDGTTAPRTIHFDKPGTQQVSEAWQTLQDGNIGSYVVLEIISPIQLLSNTIEWEQNCPTTPNTGAQLAQTPQADNTTTTSTEEGGEDTTTTEEGAGGTDGGGGGDDTGDGGGGGTEPPATTTSTDDEEEGGAEGGGGGDDTGDGGGGGTEPPATTTSTDEGGGGEGG